MMEQRKPKWRESSAVGPVDELLESRYGQLLKWAVILTRGDQGKAQDVVQELCLYFALTKPDLSGVANMDGYLHTCLRHIYLSTLARSSREAQHFISVAEFDSIEFALEARPSGDPLQRQNDLRRICGYAVWRKEASKAASYFIFHFFHGYARREIAELACIPMAAVYNKLKIARTEVKSHLEERGKLRILNREAPPEPVSSWALVSSAGLFRELRESIMSARTSACLSEQNLLGYYKGPTPAPIPCELLAHLVSCDRCLAIIDRHFRRPTLHDREPLDGFESSSRTPGDGIAESDGMAHNARLREVRRRWGSVHEHRPKTLSLAVNGRIVALHDVQAAHNMLSVRVEQPEKAEFVEVFSEQDVRFALLSIGDLPPDGSPVRLQHVNLSDSRWLELRLTFDGLGLDSQVAYFDPALASDPLEDTEDSAAVWALEPSGVTHTSHAHSPVEGSWTSAISRFLSPLIPTSAMAWAVVLALIAGSAGFMAYRRMAVPLNGSQIMEQSLKIASTSLRGQTEHQVLHLEEVSADGGVLQHGDVDLWRDGDGRRYLRRLYDSRHRLIAAKWHGETEKDSSSGNWAAKNAFNLHQLGPVSTLWDQDLSSEAFGKLDTHAPQLRVVRDGYELTVVGPIADYPQVVAATLMLDRHLRPIREIVRVRAGSEMQELRLTQTEYELRPSSSVPNATFDPGVALQDTQSFHPTRQRDDQTPLIAMDVHLAQLQIAVLHQLGDLDADTGEPIEVIRTPDGHIRVSGTVLDDSLKKAIISRLEALEDRRLLDLRLKSKNDLLLPEARASQRALERSSIYDVQRAEPEVNVMLRRHFQAAGLSGEKLNSAMGQYSQNVLQHSQRALQHAYALKRLGGILSDPRLNSIGVASQRQWSRMVNQHSQGLEAELGALRMQLGEIGSSRESTDADGPPAPIESPAQFDQAANRLLHHTQELNSDIGSLFTSNLSEERHPAPDSLLRVAINAIPLRQSQEIARFAARLSSAQPGNRLEHGDEKKVPDEPQ